MRKLVQKVVTRDTLNYRKLTDRPKPKDEDEEGKDSDKNKDGGKEDKGKDRNKDKQNDQKDAEPVLSLEELASGNNSVFRVI